MKKKLLLLLPLLLAGCAATQDGRTTCAAELDAAWKALDLAKADGFAGTVSYTKALGLLSLAKGQQSIERYDSCIEKAKRARYYIQQSRQGQ
ncbi:hypothetical protein PVT67_06850 [Gallaecimonas kandeliae]|uniref:hypothetical protein n=1 Tax=Gallaecimonas kandeliae TaxID=3029055 RepID=UPI002647F3CF|nr:hypothetical protein [Gallaecimonas kandeliae]WKE66948.1 hypothetical protein PVT67_06850 [Gallaecimonas kandeliae]